MSDQTQAPAESVPIGVRVTDWVAEHAERQRGWVALDNYDPTRRFANLALWRYPLHDGSGYGYVLTGDRDFSGPGWLALPTDHDAVYLLDDGSTVAPFYSAGWGTDGDGPEQGSEYLLLHPFPTGPDMSGWMIGPRRVYHVKVS